MITKNSKKSKTAAKSPFPDRIERARVRAIDVRSAPLATTDSAILSVTSEGKVGPPVTSPVAGVDEYRQITLYLPPPLYASVEAHAKASYQSRSEALRFLIVAGLRSVSAPRTGAA
jgi:hypothetical protein